MTILNVSEKLKEHIRREAEKSDYRVISISTRGGDAFFMEVTLDREGGITLGECGEFNRRISSWIERQDMFKNSYTLDVCSPGLDRELKNDEEFSWAAGKEVKVTLYSPVEGKSVITGKLEKVNDEGNIVIEEDGGVRIAVERKNVAKAKLWTKI